MRKWSAWWWRICAYRAWDALSTRHFARIKHAGHIHSPYDEKANEHYNITVKLLYCSRYLLTSHWTMNIWMTYIKQIYTAFIQVSGLKLWFLGDCNCAIFLRGFAPRKIAQLQSPRAHSFNQSLSWLYIFVYYIWPSVDRTTIISAWDIWFLQSICELYNMSTHVNPPDLGTLHFCVACLCRKDT